MIARRRSGVDLFVMPGVAAMFDAAIAGGEGTADAAAAARMPRRRAASRRVSARRQQVLQAAQAAPASPVGEVVHRLRQQPRQLRAQVAGG